MQVIKCLAEKIAEELHDAEDYIDLALKWKEEDEDTADLFAELSAEEMKHVNMLHEHVEEMIDDYREENGAPPKDMMTLYEYLHEKHMKDAMRIKVKQGMYKEKET